MLLKQTDQHQFSSSQTVIAPDFELWIERKPEHGADYKGQLDDIEPGVIIITKRLPTANRQDQAKIKNFEQSNELATTIQNPNFPTLKKVLLDSGEVVFKYQVSSGLSLLELLTLSIASNTPLPLTISASCILQIIHALNEFNTFVQSNGDPNCYLELNPNSIFISQDGQILISHIGIGNPPSLTTSLVSSTPQQAYLDYSAPEQCIGGRTPGQQCSIYSLGLICFELLCGRFLFSNARSQSYELVLERKLRNLHPRISDVKPQLDVMDDFVNAMLSPLPELRPTKFESLIALIENYSDHNDEHRKENFQVFYKQLIQNSKRPESTNNDDLLFETTDINELNAS